MGRGVPGVQTQGSSTLASPELCFLLISHLCVCTAECLALELGEKRSNVHSWEGRGILVCWEKSRNADLRPQMEEGWTIRFTAMGDFTRAVW